MDFDNPLIGFAGEVVFGGSGEKQGIGIARAVPLTEAICPYRQLSAKW